MTTFAFDWTTMTTIASKPARRPSVDFASVPPSQWAMHDRLENWARWARGSGGERARTEGASPMFALYRSTDAKRKYGEVSMPPIDKEDALKIHFAIVHPFFDPQCRRALQWAYLRPKNPAGTAAEMGVTMEKLAQLVRDGRALLIEKRP